MAPKVDDAKHELKRKLYDALLKGEEDKVTIHVDTGFKVPLWEAIPAEKQRYELARQPGEFLMEKTPHGRQLNLQWMKRVQKVSTTHFIKHFNCNKKTAEELFADGNAQIRENAKEWLKRTAENCSIAVLIATVAFSAA
ncbi:hypothetical protein RJ640_003591 [Escallonia rubra]|uniref:Uncharacterized protein n=1 Tax=Escallonia rubra TaxID=112253 RepID=A0AA88RIG2_9ASTE|nr:hypothetical protein RJ640_003591 [Escallonia rubra]